MNIALSENSKKVMKIFFGCLTSFVLLFIAQQASAATLSLSPSSGSVGQGQTFTVQVILNTTGQNVDGVDLYSLRFNASRLQVVDSNSGTSGVQIAPGSAFPITLINTVDNAAGTIQFSQTASGGTNYNGTGTIATITFTGSSQGTAAVTFDFTAGSTSDTNVASAGTDLLTSVTNGNYTVTTASDTTPPTVSITSPTAGATVSGTVSLTSSASDNVGVAGVQFLLDGVNLGSEDTSAPFTASWDTTTASNGSHTLTARARDTSSNTTTSSGVTVTVSNSVTPPPPPPVVPPPPPPGGNPPPPPPGANPPPPPPVVPPPPPGANPPPPPPGGGTTPDLTKYPSGLIFKYANNPTVYIKEGTLARPITDWTVYLNNVPPTRTIVTLPDNVVFPQGPVLGLRSGTLVRASNDPTVYLTTSGNKRPFSSESEFLNNSYRFDQVYTINDPNLVASYPTITTPFQRPFGTLFKYANSPEVYFLNSARLKRPFTTYNMFRLWVDDPKNVIVVPDSETYPDGPIVTLPNGILVKGSSATVYLTDQDKLRPFTSADAFQTLGFTFSDIIQITDSDLALHQIGAPY